MNCLKIISIAALLVYSGCTGSPPVLDELSWKIVYRDDGVSRFEELLLFMRMSDPDDTEDPDLLTVEVDSEGILWRFPREKWILMQEDEVRWWGMPGIVALEGGRLPDGLYRIRLEDLAGEFFETIFRPNPRRPEIEDVSWPTVVMENRKLQYSGEWPDAKIILRSLNKEFLRSLPVEDGLVIEFEEAHWWELWTAISGTSEAIRMGPFPLGAYAE